MSPLPYSQLKKRVKEMPWQIVTTNFTPWSRKVIGTALGGRLEYEKNTKFYSLYKDKKLLAIATKKESKAKEILTALALYESTMNSYSEEVDLSQTIKDEAVPAFFKLGDQLPEIPKKED